MQLNDGAMMWAVGLALALAYASWRRSAESEGGVMLVGGIELPKSYAKVNWNNQGKIPASLLQNRQISAFLRLIRRAESYETDPRAYYVLNGGEIVPNLTSIAHPARIGERGTSTAAGAYQFVAATWREVSMATWGVENAVMTQAAQDMAALQRLGVRGAIPAIIAGDLATAYDRLKNEWSSMPGGKEARIATAELRAAFVRGGGVPANGQ